MNYGDEHETIILINEGDRKNGFFRFGTSRVHHFQRLCKRVGGEDKLLKVQQRTEGSRVVWWDCQVPIEFMSKLNFAIRVRKPRSSRPKSEALIKWQESRRVAK